ncbi:hypothetical protein [Caldibacillus debilis]|uniref:Uncharacterized protein n=1 Tax=Caldibacillus debilis GB1 TaxID=1339248 RepID=A0A420VGL5_9BACI|nr:hypothetical protein [Caldibacillus debilis]RKO62680.1 hypothetical protein Cdeb_00408 [Caldibacillus debilis GB1]
MDYPKNAGLHLGSDSRTVREATKELMDHAHLLQIDACHLSDGMGFMYTGRIFPFPIDYYAVNQEDGRPGNFSVIFLNYEKRFGKNLS